MTTASTAQADTAAPASASTNTAAVARSVTLTVAGTSRSVTTYAATVGELLTTERVAVGSRDVLTPTRTTPLASVSAVRVVRVTSRTAVRTKVLHWKTIVRQTASLPKGTRVLASRPHVGRTTTKTLLTYHDGHIVSQRVTYRQVVKPVQRIVLVGTSTWPVNNRLHWAALAQCESGGNPRIVGSGQFYGLYQFTVGTWHGVGGNGLPTQASPAEQTYRAQLLYNARGRSPWPVCGAYL